MYKQQGNLSAANSLTCPECQSTRFRVSYNKVECTNCGHVEKGGNSTNKYGAKRTESRDGVKRDSKFESNIADELLLRKNCGDILDYDSQYKVECIIYRKNGLPAFKVSHKVDFRLHHLDGSYELLEAKGVETADYKWRRRCLEELWLPEHPDHVYSVIKQQKR
jgi:ribosomal protein L37AE/L43A